MTVRELLKTMTSHELEEWKAYLTLEYDKEQRGGLAQRAADGVNTRRAKMKGRR
jgi:hypothetical protein